jgi:hypothetical protein
MPPPRHASVNLNAVNLGFNSERVLLFTLNARQAGYRDFAIVQFYEEVRARLSTIPGVRGVSTSNVALISGSESSTSIKIAGYTGNNRQVSFLYVGPGFLSNMQIPILLGREIDQRDLYRGSGVAVVNQEFARTYFTNENSVGRHFSMGMIGAVSDLEVVGVSQDARYNSLKQDIAPTVYLSYSTNLITLRGGWYSRCVPLAIRMPLPTPCAQHSGSRMRTSPSPTFRRKPSASINP